MKVWVDMKREGMGYCSTKGRILWDVILMGLIAVLSCLLPFSSYVYKNIRLSIGGFDYLTGIKDCRGKGYNFPTFMDFGHSYINGSSSYVAILFPKIKRYSTVDFYC